jgi:hypothetical protein
MTGLVLPFPRVRDRAFVRRHAALMASYSANAAEKHLSTQLDLQRRTMVRRGIDPSSIHEQVKALEAAIRAELWRTVLTPGGAA